MSGIGRRESRSLRLTGTGRRQSWKTWCLRTSINCCCSWGAGNQTVWQLSDRFSQDAFKDWRTVGSQWGHRGECFDAKSLLANWLSVLKRMIDWGDCRSQAGVWRKSYLNIMDHKPSQWPNLADGCSENGSRASGGWRGSGPSVDGSSNN